MGQLASTQRVPLHPFQQYQEWRLSDVQTVISRFDREPTSFGFKIAFKTYQHLTRDLPVRVVKEDESEPLQLAAVHAKQQQQQQQQLNSHTTPRPLPSQRSQTQHQSNNSISLPPIHPAAAAATPSNGGTSQPHNPSLRREGSMEEKEAPSEQQLNSGRSSSLQPHPPNSNSNSSSSPAPPITSTPQRSPDATNVSFQVIGSGSAAPTPARNTAISPLPLAALLNSSAMQQGSSKNSPNTIRAEDMFNTWLGADVKDDDRLDILIFLASLICLCKAKFNAKLDALFQVFDFDDDGILNRTEMSQLVRAVSVGLHRIYGLTIMNPPTFIFTTTTADPSRAATLANPSSSSSSNNAANATYHSHHRPLSSACNRPGEPNSKQCERWNEQYVRRFEAALRLGVWNLEGLYEWAHSSPLAVHLLCVGLRTRTGGLCTTDAQRVQSKLIAAQQAALPLGGVGNSGAHVHLRQTKAGSREEELLGINTDRNAYSPRKNVVKETFIGASPPPNSDRKGGFNSTLTASISNSYENTIDTSASTASLNKSDRAPSPSATSSRRELLSSRGSQGDATSLSMFNNSAANRFKFTGKNTQREVKNLKLLFDAMDIDSGGYLSLEYLRKPKKYTDPFLLRDITAVFQEWKGPAPANAATGNVNEHSHAGEVSFSEMLDVLYTDLTPEEHRLLHSWVPAPVNKDTVKQIQKVFDRLDTEFIGKVKFSKIMQAFRTQHAENETYQKLIEPFSRLRPHRLEIAVNIRELLTALFNRSHSKQLKKILNWAKPTKLLTEEQQHELNELFQRYDVKNEGRFPLKFLKQHLVEQGGLHPSEVDRLVADIEVHREREFSKSGTNASGVPSTAGSSVSSAALAATVSLDETLSSSASVNVGGTEVSSDAVAPDEPMLTLQEFQIFYRDMNWADSYVNFLIPPYHAGAGVITRRQGGDPMAPAIDEPQPTDFTPLTARFQKIGSREENEPTGSSTGNNPNNTNHRNNQNAGGNRSSAQSPV